MIFIDTGAFIARYIQEDRYHRKAREGWEHFAFFGRQRI